jgi:predicted MFS family arabinose efflux permease
VRPAANKLQKGEDPAHAARWRVLGASFCSYGFDAMDFMVLALSLAYIADEFGLSLAQAGLLGTAGMLGVGLSSVVVGWYSDNFGRRRALLYCVTTFGLFTAAVYWSSGWWDVMLLRFMAGIGLGGAWGVIAAFINETWPRESRGRAASFVLSSWPVGYILAAAIAREVLPVYGWRTLFLLGGLALFAALYIVLAVPESEVWRREREQGKADRVAVGEIFGPAVRRNTVLGTLAAGAANVGYWGVNTWLPTFLVREHGLDPAGMASFVMFVNLGMFTGYQVFGWLADRIGRRRALLWCFVGASVMLPLYTAARDLTLLFWLGPVVGMFFAYSGPFGGYFPALYPTRLRSLGAGFCFDVGRGLASLAPFLFGGIAMSIGLSRSIALCALAFLLAAVVVWRMPEADS